MASAGASFHDRAFNKVAVCSALFTGFAYVGYSYAKTAFCRKLYRHPEEGEDDTCQISRTVLKRLPSTVPAENAENTMIGRTRGRLRFRQRMIQDKIRELNEKARQFGDALMAIQRYSVGDASAAVCRNDAVHHFSSIQCTPFGSPRILSPIDSRNVLSRSSDDLTSFQPTSRFKWARHSLKKRRHQAATRSGSRFDDIKKLESEAQQFLQNLPPDVIERLEELSTNASVVTPYEARCLVALLYSNDQKLIEKSLVTVANCAAFTVNLDNLRDAGCIQRLSHLIQNENLRLAAVQTLGNVILSEENILEAGECLPILMNLVQNDQNDEGLILAALVVLTNLATTTDWHKEFDHHIICRLYELVGSRNSHIQIQSLRLLVNLSCNKDVVPALLTPMSIQQLAVLIEVHMSESLLLRSLSLLITLCNCIKELTKKQTNPNQSNQSAEKESDQMSVDESDQERPVFDLLSYKTREVLLVKCHAIIMTHSPNSDIQRQATRLYNILQQS